MDFNTIIAARPKWTRDELGPCVAETNQACSEEPNTSQSKISSVYARFQLVIVVCS